MKKVLKAAWEFCRYVFVPQRRPKDDSAAEKTAIMVHGEVFTVNG